MGLTYSLCFDGCVLEAGVVVVPRPIQQVAGTQLRLHFTTF